MNKKSYVFYRHYSLDGGYLAAEHKLVEQVLHRANWTQAGKERAEEQRKRVLNGTPEPIKDPDKVKWRHARGMRA